MDRIARPHVGLLASLLGALLLSSAAPVAAVSGATPQDSIPNLCSQAETVAPGPWRNDTIWDAADIDWLRFTLAKPSHVLITLSLWDYDLSLRLYGGCRTLLATSDRAGVQYEEIDRTLPAGTYRLRIAGQPELAPWSLRIRIIPRRVVVLSSSAFVPYPATFPDRWRVVGEVLNGTGSARQDIQLRLRFLAPTGATVATRTTWARRERLLDGQRSMFDYYEDDIAGVAGVQVTLVASPLATYPPLRGLTARPTGVTPDGFGGRTFKGVIRNTNSYPIIDARVMVTLYDVHGDVINVDLEDLAPGKIPAGGARTYAVHVDPPSEANRVVVTTHGYKDPHG